MILPALPLENEIGSVRKLIFCRANCQFAQANTCSRRLVRTNNNLFYIFGQTLNKTTQFFAFDNAADGLTV